MRLNCFFCSSRRRHTRFDCDWSSDVCSSDLNIRRSAESRKHVADCLIDALRGREIRGHHTGPAMRLFVQSRCVLVRSEEHTSELQSQSNLVCRLLLEKKKNKDKQIHDNMIHT